MKIHADTELCIGAGQCVLAAARYFDQSDEDGTVVVLQDSPEPGDEEAVREAATVCPSGALSIIE